MSRRLIFLDIDGVLTTHRHAEKLYLAGTGDCLAWDPEALAALNDLCARTGAEVVVSSAWRLHYKDVAEMAADLAERGLRGSIIGRTPRLHGRGCATVDRGVEIQAWLDVHGQPSDRFAIVDDDSDMAHLAPFLVLTDGEVGLTENDAVRVEYITQAVAA